MTVTVLKIGGSQTRHDRLMALCAMLGEMGARQPLLVVPGGGDFADAVRRCNERYPLSETAAHWMAILAMDQYGHVLADLIPGSRIVRSLSEVQAVTRAGRVPVLLPHDWMRADDPLPHSWDVTSDSIAAWVAQQAQAHRLILVKDVDGLYETFPPSSDTAFLTHISVDRVNGNGGVDRFLAGLLEKATCATWVVNGRFPERVAQLLETGTARGTRICPNQAGLSRDLS
ncbi:hypothetical protein GO013_08435 [Pseudodesulfovibrio sp. JC047]|uniref:amino acid kinase family protein n=1 Tax=Pseudodesulfovibrio sp. JC047 TaxID=2683199 RepID=UPI0013D37124|nr:hypothetical protein [Pseudodesulfovibrio sp. JC047]NDV19442.1 hypothetical protein [Pseudodesulfovibrio sp. JC047]